MCERQKREREREREESNNTKEGGERGTQQRVLLREPSSVLVLIFQKFFWGQLLHVLGFFKPGSSNF